MAGALYIWIIGAFFLFTVIIILVFSGLFGLGHWFDRKIRPNPESSTSDACLSHAPSDTLVGSTIYTGDSRAD